MTLEQYSAMHAVARTKARYCRFLDTKQWELWGQLFTEDAILDVSEDVTAEMGPQIIHGRTAIVAQVKDVCHTAQTTHQVHSPEIDMLSPTSARAIWAMQDVVVWPDVATRPVREVGSLTGFGHYHETYSLVGGSWLIATLRLSRLQRIFT